MILGRSRDLCGRSWVALGASAGSLGLLLGPMLAVLGGSWGLCGRSWAALGAYVGGPGPLLGPMLAVLGGFWGLCGRSWAALGAYVGGPWPLLGPMLAVLGEDQGLSWWSWALCWRSWAKSGSNPSEDVIWQADQGREVAQTRAGRPFWGGNRFGIFWVPAPPVDFFL